MVLESLKDAEVRKIQIYWKDDDCSLMQLNAEMMEKVKYYKRTSIRKT